MKPTSSLQYGQILLNWFLTNSFAPSWLPKRLRAPAFGYILAAVLQVVAIVVTLSLVQIFPSYAFVGLTEILVIALIALYCGAGPGLIATIFGAVLLCYFIVPIQFSWTISTTEGLIEMFLFLVVSLIISIVASSVERARRNAQELATSLETERARLDAIIETVPDAVSIFDVQGKIQRLNRVAKDKAGPSGADTALENLISLYNVRDQSGESITLEQSPVVQTLHGKTISGAEIRYIDSQAQEHFITMSSAPLLDPNGTLNGVVVISHDTSEQRKMERRTSEALNALLEMAEALVFSPSKNATTGELTAAASQKVAQRLANLTCSVLGCKRVAITAIDPETQIPHSMAVVGLSPEQERAWFARDSGFHLSEIVTTTIDADELQSGEVLLLDLTQPPFIDHPNPFGIKVMLLAPMYINNQLVGQLSLDHGGEQHEYSQNELTLVKAIARLIALVIDRERLMRERAEARASELALREANRRMDEFLGMTSHELKTPLTSIKGNTQLAARQLRINLQNMEKMQVLLEGTDRQIRLLNRLVDDLLDMSRMQTDHLELWRKQCNLETIVNQTIEEQRQAWPARTIVFKRENTDQQLVYADPERIGQVMTNFLTNALKYSDEEKPIEVTLRQEDTAKYVCVRDEGPGLSPEEQQSIWERFHRVEGVEVRSNPHGSTVGLGLGLYISKIIIEQHGGSVGVQSRPKEGSTFWFRLPIEKEREEE